MDREPWNFQVVFQGMGENDLMLLIDENDLICAIKPSRHLIPPSFNQLTTCRLCELGSIYSLTEISNELKAQLEELQESLAEAERAIAKEVRQLENEITKP